MIGEVLNEKYKVFSSLGKGVFSSVVRAKVLGSEDDHVAIKVIRNNEIMQVY